MSEKGIEKVIEVAKQLHEKKGPYYEKWKAAVEAAKEKQRAHARAAGLVRRKHVRKAQITADRD